MTTYTDLDLMKICVRDERTLACPLMRCDTTFDVPPVPISDELGAVFGMSGDTLARVHGEQSLKRTARELRIHLANHPYEDWLEELLEAQSALKEQIAMWAEMGRA